MGSHSIPIIWLSVEIKIGQLCLNSSTDLIARRVNLAPHRKPTHMDDLFRHGIRTNLLIWQQPVTEHIQLC